MAVVWVVLAAVVVFVIAAVVVGREVRRLSAQAPRPVFDVDEAVAWIADRLPFEVAARIAHDDVRTVVTLAVDHLRLDEPSEADDRLVTDHETWAHVVERCEVDGDAVQAVLELQARYLTAIGAAGPVAFEPPEKGGGPTEQSL